MTKAEQQPDNQQSSSLPQINIPSMKQLTADMQDKLQQAHQVINDSIEHSKKMMENLLNAQPTPSDPQPASSPAQSTQQATGSANTDAPDDAVKAAVQTAAKHEQSMFQHIQQDAQQYFQNAEKMLHPQQQEQEQQFPAEYLDEVSAEPHGGVNQGESLLQHMEKYMLEAEQAIQNSLASIHHAIAGQNQKFEQQQQTTGNKPNEPQAPNGTKE